MTLPQLASQPALPVAVLSAATGNAPRGKHSASDTASSDATKGGGPFAQLIAKAIAGAASSKASAPEFPGQQVTKQVSSTKTTDVPQAGIKSAAPAQQNLLAQLLAAQSSAARNSQVSGKPAVQPETKGETSDESGKALASGKTASPTAAPVDVNSVQISKSSTFGQTIAVRHLPSAPDLRQTTKSDGLPHRTNKTVNVSGSGSAPRRDEAASVGKLRAQPGAHQPVLNPKQVQEQETVPQPEIQGQPLKQSPHTAPKTSADGPEKHPVAKQTALLLKPDLAVASNPLSAPPSPPAGDSKAPQNSPSEPPQSATGSNKATAARVSHGRQTPSGPVAPVVTEPAPAPVPMFPLPLGAQPANSGNRKAIAQPAAPSAVSNSSTPPATTPPATPSADPAPMPGEHFAFALSATATPVANRAASEAAPQTSAQADSQPVTVSGPDTEASKNVDRAPASAPAPGNSVPQQTFAMGAGAWQPAASFAGPSHQAPPAPAPPQAAAPDLHEPDRPVSQDPLRVLRVQFTGDNNQKVDVRMGDAGGALRVSVRSTDAGLTQALQTNLPELTARLGSQHFHTEVWMPQSANVGTGNSGAGSTATGGGRPGGFSFTGGHPNGQGQPGSGQQQNRQNHYQPEWMDDFQVHPRRAQMTRRS